MIIKSYSSDDASSKRTVYILGSGFSASCGLPTVRDLFQAIFKLPDSYNREKNIVKHAITRLYPFFKDYQGSESYPPFEEFLSLCSATIDFESENTHALTPYVGNSWFQTYEAATHLLEVAINEITNTQKSEDAEPLLRFIDNLSDDDVILTFNWDTLIERCLFKKGRKISYNLSEKGKITILKLHGSLSWFKLKEGLSFLDGMPPPTTFIVSEADKIVCPNDFHYVSESRFAQGTGPVIITPTNGKNPFNQSLLLREIWYEAFNHIIQAQSNPPKIIAIGYSIPSYDLHARALLRSAFLFPTTKDSPEHILIDPDPDVAGRYYSQVSENFKYMQKKFTGDEFKRIETEEYIKKRRDDASKKVV